MLTNEQLLRCSYDEAENHYDQGRITDVQWNRYRVLWRNSVYRYSHVAEHFEKCDGTCHPR